MKKWMKAALFLLPILIMIAAVNWYVDSYALLRVTYDQIGRQMAQNHKNVAGLEESDFNDRNLLLATLRQQERKDVFVMGSSRVFTFEQGMFDTDSFYNAGLSEATVYDLMAVADILVEEDKLPDTMIIGVDAFLFNASHNNEKWKELEGYANAMRIRLDGKYNEHTPRPDKNTGKDNGKWLSLDYFRYNVTLLPERKRFAVSYTDDWETDVYLKHYDGSVAYEEPLRTVGVEEVEAMTRQAIEEQVVYRMTDYREVDEELFWDFSALLDFFLEQGVEVILYLPPYSPMMYNYIESEEAFQIAMQVEQRVLALADKRGIALYGSYNPEGSGLEMTDLYDVYHVKTEKMMDTYFPVLPAK